MTIPWQAHTRKEIAGITHRRRRRTGHSFVPPAPQSRVDFSHAQLCASMAMTNALSGLSAAASGSLAQAMSQLVTDHVDDATPLQLQFLGSVAHLADSARTFFSSCIATGVADQYALALGFRFRCNSREVIPRGRAGDFLYDGPPVPTHSAVMIESKGSLRARLNTAAFHTIVNQGYTGQVRPHVGKSYPLHGGGTLQIVHGYSIGCAAQVPLVNAIGHVVETAPSGGKSQSMGGSQPQGPATNGGHASNATIALGNYLGVATLIGDEVMRRSIEEAREGNRLKQRARSRNMRVITWRDEQFLMFEDEELSGTRRKEDKEPYLSRMPRPRFAIWSPMYRKLHWHLSHLPEQWVMPEVPAELRSNEIKDGGAVLPDGCALLPPWVGLEADIQAAPPLAVPPAPSTEEAWENMVRLIETEEVQPSLEQRHLYTKAKLTR